MNAQTLAGLLNGREYCREITGELEAQAKQSGLVVVFGGSDDLVEFRGAIHDERGAPGDLHLTRDGLLENECDDSECPYFEKLKAAATVIEAIWCEEPELSWSYKTTIPHATFNVMEDGETYCRGIVFALSDVGKTDAVDASLATRLSAAAGLLAGHGHKDSAAAVLEAAEAMKGA